MRSFCRKLFCFLLILGIITLGVNQWYVVKDHTFDKAIRYRNMPYDIQVCNTGSSHGAASFQYDALPDGYTGFNFGSGWQLPVYDARLVEQYADHLADGGVLLIVISYFSLFREMTDTYNFTSYNRSYYSVLPDEMVYAYDRKADILAKLPSLTSYFDLLPTLLKREEVDDGTIVEADPEEVRASAEGRYQGHVADDRGPCEEENVEAVYRIVAICREKNITPVMITTPLLSEFPEEVRRRDPAFFDDFYGAIDEICDNTGMRYYDYSEDERFTNDYSLFSDADHMNERGSERFTQVVYEEILKDILE